MTRLVSMLGNLPKESIDKLPALAEHCSSFAQPIVKSGLDAQRRALQYAAYGNPRRKQQLFQTLSGHERIEWGEIFYVDNQFYIFYTERSGGRLVLRLRAISALTNLDHLDAFVDAALEVVGVKLSAAPVLSREFDQIKKEAKYSFATPTNEEIASAKILADSDVRSLAVAIKQAGGLLESDLSKQVRSASADVDNVVSKLEVAGFLTEELVILCKATSRQVFKLPEAKILQKMAQGGVRCACGRSISDERQEKAVSLTNLGSSLLDKSRWLSILVYDELVQAGVLPDRILVEATLGGDEVDCLADIRGELSLFELKDKEFNLREAYSFGAKIGIVKPWHAIVVTTVGVGGDAREHFSRAFGKDETDEMAPAAFRRQQVRTARIRYIEKVENLKAGIREFVSSIMRTDSIEILQRVLDDLTPDAAALMEAAEQHSKS